MQTPNYTPANSTNRSLYTAPIILRRPASQLPHNGLTRLPSTSQPLPPRLPQPTSYIIRPSIQPQQLINTLQPNAPTLTQPESQTSAKNATHLTSSPNEIKNHGLPTKLNINFSNWFFGDLKDLKSKSSDTIKPLIDEYLRTHINSKLEAQNLEFLTERPDTSEPAPLSHIKCYSFSLEKEKISPNTVEFREVKRLSKKSSNTCDPTQPAPITDSPETVPESENISLILQSNNVIIDRQAFFRRRDKLKTNNSNVPDSNSDSLIAQNENCDGSDDDMKIIEIDCDTCLD